MIDRSNSVTQVRQRWSEDCSNRAKSDPCRRWVSKCSYHRQITTSRTKGQPRLRRAKKHPHGSCSIGLFTSRNNRSCLFSFAVIMWMTTAGCNQHLFVVFSQQLYALRGLKRGSPNPNHNQIKSSSFSSPSLSVTGDPMGNNYRPIQPTHHRPVRTNIDFTSSEVRRDLLSLFVCCCNSGEM